MSKHHHIGLLTAGQGFLNSANKLNDSRQSVAAPLAVYYLYLHGIELAIKSFIYQKNQDEKELIAIGHDLEKAWDRAKELGVEQIFTKNQELFACIAIINPMYKGKELEYFYPGLKALPEIDLLGKVCNELSHALDQYYRTKLKACI